MKRQPCERKREKGEEVSQYGVVRGSIDTQASHKEKNQVMKKMRVEQFASRELFQLQKVNCGLITCKYSSLALREISDRKMKLKLND